MMRGACEALFLYRLRVLRGAYHRRFRQITSARTLDANASGQCAHNERKHCQTSECLDAGPCHCHLLIENSGVRRVNAA
jgi:hypothetical protein